MFWVFYYFILKIVDIVCEMPCHSEVADGTWALFDELKSYKIKS